MPETYGLPEPQPEPTARVRLAINEAIAGQGVVRRIILYVLMGGCAISPLPATAIVPLILLMATDSALA